jgi:adenylyltransferase/sulfurtransferase
VAICQNRKVQDSPRYGRQRVLPGFGAPAQEALAAARVLVIGAGGLGSTVIPALAAAGVGTIGIMDDDRVEESNLHRQLLHGHDDIGRSKVDSAAETVARQNPATTVHPIRERLTRENALELVDYFDLVIDGSDNFPTRYLSSDAAELTGTPLIWGSVSQYGGQASVSLPGGPGYRDLFPTPPPPGSVQSCEVGGVLPTVCATIGSIMATEAIKVLTGVGTPLVGRVTIVDALSGTFRELDFAADPEREPVTALIDYEVFCGLAAASSLTAPELAAELETGDIVLIDVREPWEAALASIPGATLIPLGQFGLAARDLDLDADLIIHCHHDMRSQRARDHLVELGAERVRYVVGGIDAWSRLVDPTVARY